MLLTSTYIQVSAALRPGLSMAISHLSDFIKVPRPIHLLQMVRRGPRAQKTMYNKQIKCFRCDLSYSWLFLMKACLEKFWNVKSLDVEMVSSYVFAMDHKQPGSEVQEDVTFIAVPSPTAPEEADNFNPKRSWQKLGAKTHPQMAWLLKKKSLSKSFWPYSCHGLQEGSRDKIDVMMLVLKHRKFSLCYRPTQGRRKENRSEGHIGI